jgi:hypothetical protein
MRKKAYFKPHDELEEHVAVKNLRETVKCVCVCVCVCVRVCVRVFVSKRRRRERQRQRGRDGTR